MAKKKKKSKDTKGKREVKIVRRNVYSKERVWVLTEGIKTKIIEGVASGKSYAAVARTLPLSQERIVSLAFQAS